MRICGQAVKTTLVLLTESWTVALLQSKLLLRPVAEPFPWPALRDSPPDGSPGLWPLAHPELPFAVGLKCHPTCLS